MINLGARVDQATNNKAVVFIKEVNVNQVRRILPHVNQFPTRAVVLSFDDRRPRQSGIVRSRAVSDAFVDGVKAADSPGRSLGQVLDRSPGFPAVCGLVQEGANVLAG